VGVHDSLRSLEWVVQDSLENSEWGCRIPYDSRDFIFPEGIPNFLGGGKFSVTPEFILLQNMDSLWKILTTSQRLSEKM